MPGTPPTTPNFAIPRWAGGDAADYPTQTNASIDQIDSAVGARVLQMEPTVVAPAAALPSSPFDGQEIIVFSGVSGVFWRFRYYTSAAKWRFVGGPPAFAGPNGYSHPGTGGAVDGTGPSITIPYSGDYIVWFTVNAVSSGPTPTNFFAQVFPKYGGAADNTALGINWETTISTGGHLNVTHYSPASRTIGGGTVLKMRYYSSGSWAVTFSNVQLFVLPISLS